MQKPTRKNLVERIEELDAKIAAIVSQKDARASSSAAREELMLHYAKRGSISVDIGVAEAGLADLLRAYAQRDKLNLQADGEEFETLHGAYVKSTPLVSELPYWLWSRLGEGFRRYALDVLLTRTEKQQDVYDAIHRSIDCFKKAEFSAREGVKGGIEPPTPARRAWVLAHRAAARTTLYWMSISASRPLANVFEVAAAEFKSAIDEQQKDSTNPDYVWAKRFRAFLYALRGEPGDYKKAHAELKSIDVEDSTTQSSLNRSLAMLSSYDAVPPAPSSGGAATPVADRAKAARAALESAMVAVTQDPEDFMASYFGAVATWILSDLATDTAEKQRYERRAKGAIDGARVRSMSIISQAYATLAGLELMTEMMQSTSKENANDAASVLHRMSDFPPDWETRAIFMRDPVWQTVKNDKRYSHVFTRRAGLPNFDSLREKYQVWPANVDPEDAK